MRNYSRFAWIFVLLAMTAFVACDKDNDDDDDDNIVQKNGIALTGAQEVPAKQTNATGTADVTYNKTTKVLNYSISWTNLSDLPTGAHIHGAAARGVNAGVKHDFFSSIPQAVSGNYSGMVTVDNLAIKEDSLLAGFYYFNIHTPLNPAGEIRGQIEF